MLPIILAGASMLASAQGASNAADGTVSGAKQQGAINGQAIKQRLSIQDDLAARNKPYYDQGLAQLPSILAMSKNPDFDATGSQFGDKYSQGVKSMLLSSMAKGRNLVPMSELLGNLNLSEQGRLLNRRLDQLKVGYGQAGTAGNNLMSTGTAIADIGQRIGNTQANAMTLAGLTGRQNVENLAQGASYIPLYLNYKRLNAGE